MLRKCYESIIITSGGHIISILFTYHNISYSFLISICTLSSLLWHLHHEDYNIYFYLDYILSIILATYEIIYCQIFYLAFYLNLTLFLLNKITDFFAKKQILNYEVGHSFFHIFSIFKTIIISFYI